MLRAIWESCHCEVIAREGVDQGFGDGEVRSGREENGELFPLSNLRGLGLGLGQPS